MAPPYYLEGLLYNAPPNVFNTDWQTAIAGCLSWAVQTDKTQLLCASRQHWLVRDNQNTLWPRQIVRRFWPPPSISGQTGASQGVAGSSAQH